jgi:hypothetical protein
LAEHLRLLAGIEAGQPAVATVGGGQEQTPSPVLAARPNLAGGDDLQLGAPQQDPYDARVVQWVGKRLYLGPEGSQIRELSCCWLRGPACPTAWARCSGGRRHGNLSR